MTISRAVRGTVAGLAVALIAAFPAALTPAALADIDIPVLQSPPKEESLELTNAPNARDIGGFLTWGAGGKLASGQVFRSDALNKLDAGDQQKLVSAGITKSIDFRSPAERGQNPDKLPDSIPEESLPVYDPNNDFYLFLAKAVQGGPAAQQQLLGDGKAAQFMVGYYRWMIIDPIARQQFGTAFKMIANSSGSILYHCTAGKDRTGWMTAILMSALGVPKWRIYQDYLASNENLKVENDATLKAMVASGKVTDPSLFEPVLGVDRSYLDGSFDQVEQSFGSFDAFLSKGLDIDDATVNALKAKLLNR
ncbi:MAG: protein-tyrosine-phosphatase [Nocardia sp.]|uniref:tyrosine-protein phosphatase n=1 Tax=Nocardia sp. TaxID=1821 RepID=UPI00260E849A|nr:tyrosine-protein phosphatase [Nocardia sp.]MCU1644380.1 protein-tyrosine-phosphatase [Nocardia sp.]